MTEVVFADFFCLPCRPQASRWREWQLCDLWFPCNWHSTCVCTKSLQSCPTLCDPMDDRPPGSSVHGDSPGKNTGVGCHALLQGADTVVALKRKTFRGWLENWIYLPAQYVNLLEVCIFNFSRKSSKEMFQREDFSKAQRYISEAESSHDPKISAQRMVSLANLEIQPYLTFLEEFHVRMRTKTERLWKWNKQIFLQNSIPRKTNSLLPYHIALLPFNPANSKSWVKPKDFKERL